MKGQRGRAGWSEQETALLLNEVEQMRAQGQPLKSAFEIMAEKTGRMPNSIRNYYYAQMRSQDAEHKGAFTPFTKAETEDLITAVLAGQAGGMSVRGVTLMLAGGDKKAMLRYQNKYRSMVKNNPEEVLRIYESMKAQGQPTFNPYCEQRPHKSGRKPNAQKEGDFDAVLKRLGDSLRKLKGLDADLLLRQLAALAGMAAQDES